MTTLYFETSREAAKAITTAFDFVAPAQASLWSMRSALQTKLARTPEMTEPELHAEFFAPASVRYTNIRRWAQRPWEDHEQQFARLLLITFCSIYEAWLAATVAKLGLAPSLEKALQFPSKGTKGVGHALAALPSSAVITRCFSESLKRHRKHSHKHLEVLLKCYRVFKEARNAIAHEGAVASTKAVAAHQDFASIPKNDLGPVATLPMPVPVIGSTITLPFRGVIGFSDVVLRLIVTIDAALAQTSTGEIDLRRRWLAQYGKTKLYGFRDQRHSRLALMLRRLTLPAPRHLEVLAGALKKHDVLWYP